MSIPYKDSGSLLRGHSRHAALCTSDKEGLHLHIFGCCDTHTWELSLSLGTAGVPPLAPGRGELHQPCQPACTPHTTPLPHITPSQKLWGPNPLIPPPCFLWRPGLCTHGPNREI